MKRHQRHAVPPEEERPLGDRTGPEPITASIEGAERRRGGHDKRRALQRRQPAASCEAD